ncbi:Ig domain-containing protein [Brevibacillus sp. B_LB10_24]|uniref:Ig-like domain-containing protein n=1 Tax=Brevibacillus sp. B_LB10_24 TaxID=3380645 RepID=UPI0038BADA9D
MKVTGLARIISLLLVIVLGTTGLGNMNVFAEEISRLVLNKNELSMEVGGTQSITATAVYVSGKTEDVTIKTDWKSETPDVATVYSGSVSAKAEGTAVLTASYMGQAVIVNVNVTKKVKALTKDKQTVDLRLGKSEQVELTAIYQDGKDEKVTKKADWSSDNSTVATVTNGLITGHSSGEANVTARFGNQTVTIPVSVEIVKRLDPEMSQVSLLLKGKPLKIKLNATYPNGTVEDVADKAEWTTDKETVADALKGTITAYGPGQAIITAKYGTKTATIKVDVDHAIRLELEPHELFMKKNETKDVRLSATYPDETFENITTRAEWSTSDEKIVSVYQGKLSANAVGEAVITAKYGDKTVSMTVDVEVPRRLELNKDLVSLQTGKGGDLELTAFYANNTKEEVTKQAEWSSDNEAVAYVSKGKITAYKAGEATITAKYAGKTVTAKVSVDIPSKIVPNNSSVGLQIGDTEQIGLTAVYPDGKEDVITDKAEWSTASASVAEVRNGLITGVGTGSTTITAKYGTRTATIKVSVGVLLSLTADKNQLVLKKGDSQTIVLTAKYADGKSKDVAEDAAWTSSNPQAATVEAGKITAVGSGETTITAAFDNKTVKITVQVDMASTLKADPVFMVISLGETKQISLLATDLGGASRNVTNNAEWSTSNVKIAQVSNGMVTPIANGKVTITAKYGGKTVSIPVEVGVIQKLEADKVFINTKTGQKVQINLTATLSDGTKKDVTPYADWKTAAYKIAEVKDGLVTATGYGKTKVTARYEGKSVSIPVEVDILKYLKTDVVQVELSKGSTKQVKAVATYVDGSEADVTKPALWTSSNIMIADVKDGVIKATGKGTVNVTVSYAGKKTNVKVTVR